MRRREGGAGTGTCGCGSQLHPRADPGRTPSATTGPPWVRAPWNAKAGKAGGALDRRVSSFGVCSGAPHPLTLWGKGKEDGQTPSPTKPGADEAWPFAATHARFRIHFFCVRPRVSGGPGAKLPDGTTGPPLARGRTRREVASDPSQESEWRWLLVDPSIIEVVRGRPGGLISPRETRTDCRWRQHG